MFHAGYRFPNIVTKMCLNENLDFILISNCKLIRVRFFIDFNFVIMCPLRAIKISFFFQNNFHQIYTKLSIAS